MRHTQQRVLHLFEFLELLFITINQYKLMQYVPMKIFLFFSLYKYVGRAYILFLALHT